jgi:predicted TIM-barrel fold metal-dependent hydrolase
MIIDVHTHIFPPEVRDDRTPYLERDATFRQLYSRPAAAIATAEELLQAMDVAGVDVAVACGFAWSDAELCRWHNDYLLAAAAGSAGRILPFCTFLPSAEGARDELKRLAARGARGLGELRPANQGYGLIDSEEADLLAWGANAYDLALLFHTSEPVGHAYPGKEGLPLDQLWRFIADFPGVNVIAAHWGGGLPFYALMPEVRDSLATAYVDTAGTSYLYSPDVFPRAVDLLGAQRILFGSDFPLRPLESCLDEVRAAAIDDDARALILGENARKLLRLGNG